MTKRLLSLCQTPRLAVLLLLVLLASLAGRSPAAAQGAVQTSQGRVTGAISIDGAAMWLGIPYAAAPLGPLRWSAPAVPPRWTGERAMAVAGPPCTQQGASGLFGSEDCLFLNIYAPPGAKARSLPVMVWIHGGSNISGQGDSFDGGTLAVRQNVVVVTVNYRLALLGWLHHASLGGQGRSRADASGNYGLLDQIAALQWIRRNIAGFGGDPGNVTLFGESAGGANVLGLLVSKPARGLFHRAISQSPSIETATLAQAQNLIDAPEPGGGTSSGEILIKLLMEARLAADRGSAIRLMAGWSSAQTAAFLRSRSPAQLFAAQAAIFATADVATFIYNQPLVRDGYVLPADGIEAALDRGESSPVPIILGTTRDEATGDVVGFRTDAFSTFNPARGGRIVKDPVRFYKAADLISQLHKATVVDAPAAALARKAQAPVFVYRFDWDRLDANDKYTGGLSLRAVHALDVAFVFGNLRLPDGYAAAHLITGPNVRSFNQLADAMMAYWAGFARYGSPKPDMSGLPLWETWTSHGDRPGAMMVFASESDGGPHMVESLVNREDVISAFASDPFFRSDLERCHLLRDIRANSVSSRVSDADVKRFVGGKC